MDIKAEKKYSMEEGGKDHSFSSIVRNKFFDLTPIHGFSFISHTSSLFEKLVWAVLILGFLGVMGLDTTRLVLQYMDKPTGTTVEMVFKDYVPVPPLTLCLPTPPGLFLRWSARQSYAAALGPNGELGRPLEWESAGEGSWPSVEELRLILASGDFANRSDLLEAESWSGPNRDFLLALCLRLYDELRSSESYTGNSRVDSRQDRAEDDGLLEEFSRWLRERNVTLADLWPAVGRNLAERLGLGFTIRKPPSNNPAMARLDRGFTSFSARRSCLHMDFEEDDTMKPYFKVSGAKDFVELGIDYGQTLLGQVEPDLLSTLLLDVTQADQLDDSQHSLALGEHIQVFAEILGRYESLPRQPRSNETRCSANASLDDCSHQCRSRLIQKLCRCNPLSHGPGRVGLRSCDFLDYYPQDNGSGTELPDCLVYSGSDDEGCMGSCLSHCVQWKYAVATEKGGAAGGSSAAVRLRLHSRVYPSFREVDAYSWQNFLGDVGGTIGLWLGASFLSVIHLVVFFGKLCWECCHHRRRPDSLPSPQHHHFQERIRPTPELPHHIATSYH